MESVHFYGFYNLNPSTFYTYLLALYFIHDYNGSVLLNPSTVWARSRWFWLICSCLFYGLDKISSFLDESVHYRSLWFLSFLVESIQFKDFRIFHPSGMKRPEGLYLFHPSRMDPSTLWTWLITCPFHGLQNIPSSWDEPSILLDFVIDPSTCWTNIFTLLGWIRPLYGLDKIS